MTMYADKALRCVTCGAEFVFTAGEQQFHASKGFTNEPRRCLACRQARRGGANRADAAPLRPETAEQPARDEATVSAERGERQERQERPARAARTATAATAEPARQRYTATCSACGGEALLPFEPVGNRPVLCSSCYDKIRTA